MKKCITYLMILFCCSCNQIKESPYLKEIVESDSEKFDKKFVGLWKLSSFYSKSGNTIITNMSAVGRKYLRIRKVKDTQEAYDCYINHYCDGIYTKQDEQTLSSDDNSSEHAVLIFKEETKQLIFTLKKDNDLDYIYSMTFTKMK